VSGQGDLKQRLSINVITADGDKIFVPFTNIGRSPSVLIRVGLISSRQGLATVVFAVLQNLCDDGCS